MGANRVGDGDGKQGVRQHKLGNGVYLGVIHGIDGTPSKGGKVRSRLRTAGEVSEEISRKRQKKRVRG